MLISVDFWKSMHGFAMDSRTRELVLKMKAKKRGKEDKKGVII